MNVASFFGGAKAASSFGWSFVGIGGQGFVRLAALTALARLISPEHFGIFAIATAMIGLLPMTVFTALRLYLVRSADSRAELSGAVILISLLACVCAVALFIPFAETLERVMSAPQLSAVMAVLTIMLVFEALAVVPEAFLLGTEQFKQLGLIELWSAVSGPALIATALALWLNWGVWALAFGAITQSGMRCLLLWVLVRPHVRLKIEWPALKPLFRFSGGMVATQIANYMALQGDTFIVGRALGADALGIYGRAYQLMAVPATMLGGVIDRILYPIFCRARNHRRFFRRELIFVITRLATVLLPTAACLALAGPEIIRILLGPDWTSAIVPFQILVVALYFRAAYKVGDCVLRALGHVYNAALRHWIYAALVVGGAGFGTLWGLPGVALGITMAIFVNYLSILSLASRKAAIAPKRILIAHVPAVILTLSAALVIGITVSILRAHATSSILVVLGAFFVLGILLAVALFLPMQGVGPRTFAEQTYGR